MKVTLCSYDELPDWAHKSDLPNNGRGKEYAGYLLIEHKLPSGNETRSVYSDAMEPEDAQFFRDLKWIKEALDDAYQKGWLAGMHDAKE